MLPSFTGYYGGPSILSDDLYVYTATPVENGSGDKYIYFTMLDIETSEEVTKLYSGDDSYWENPLQMVLYQQGCLYFIELGSKRPDFGYSEVKLMKIDFLTLDSSDEPTVSEIYRIGYSYIGSDYLKVFSPASSFMTLCKNSGINYLVFDVIVETNDEVKDRNVKVKMPFLEEYDYVEYVDPCYVDVAAGEYKFEVPEANEQNYVRPFQTKKVLYFVFDLDSESLVNDGVLWQNNYLNDPYDCILNVYSIPSPIFYENCLYLIYSTYNDGQFLYTGSTNLSVVYPGGSYGFYITCNICSFGYGALGYDVPIAWNQYTKEFLGHMFFITAKIDLSDINSVEVTTEEIGNGTSFSITYTDYPSQPVWYATCGEDGIDCTAPGWEECEYGYNVGYPWGGISYPAPREACPVTELINLYNVSPKKVVLDVDSKCLYIKVENAIKERKIINPMYPDDYPPDYNCAWTPDSSDYPTIQLMKININDFKDNVVVSDGLNLLDDLTMTKRYAYIYKQESTNGKIYKASDYMLANLVVDCGVQFPAELPEDAAYGMRLSQQPSTDEDRIWKMYPVLKDDLSEPDEFKLIGYSVVGGGSREYTMPAPFLFSDMKWFNLHQHDGKFILSTADSSDPPVISTWLIK